VVKSASSTVYTSLPLVLASLIGHCRFHLLLLFLFSAMIQKQETPLTSRECSQSIEDLVEQRPSTTSKLGLVECACY